MKVLITILIIFIIFEIPISFGMGLIFKKKNLEFKKGIIPFYNKIILIKKYNLPQYHLILTFIPIIGLYTNFIINSKLVNNKDIIYVIELTLLPFIFNIFLGLELNENQKEEIENYFENQKEFYSKEETNEPKKEHEDEYIWYAKPKIKSDTIYKATRNKMNAKINLNIQKTNTIIDKKPITQSKNKITCPNCGAKLPEKTEVCFVCGTKI